MRNLRTSDIFAMSKILKKMDLKFTVEEGISQTEMGVKIIKTIIENLYLAQDEVNAFLAGLVDIPVDEFNDLPIEDTLEIIKLFKEQKGLSSFLKLAGK